MPPRWITEPNDHSSVLGNPVSIECRADGFPIPTVHWKQAIGKYILLVSYFTDKSVTV